MIRYALEAAGDWLAEFWPVVLVALVMAGMVAIAIWDVTTCTKYAKEWREEYTITRFHHIGDIMVPYTQHVPAGYVDVCVERAP